LTATFFSALAFTGCSSPAGGSPSVALATPVISSVGSPTASSLTIQWGAISGATGYKLFRESSATGGFATQVNATDIVGNSYSDTSLSPSTKYYYKVQATDGSNVSSKSDAVSGTTAAATVPFLAAPVISSIDNSTSYSLTIHWNAVTGASSYKLYYDWQANGSFGTQIGTTTQTSYTDPVLLPNTKYYYKVLAYDGSSVSSAKSGAVGNTTKPDTSTAGTWWPSASASCITGAGYVRLDWTAYSGSLLGYNIYRVSSRSGIGVASSLNSAPITAITYSDYTAVPGTNYYYAVCGVFSVSGVQTEGVLSPYVPGYR
jgi:fibronectin type 3 domain-containing protein